MNDRINMDLAISKGLIVNDDYDLYVKIANIYKHLFEIFLLEKLHLKFYDEKIENSDLHFGKASPTKEQRISGLDEFLDLDYIYLLNYFFVEKLELKDIELLKNNIDDFHADTELLDLVSRTYLDVIDNNFSNGKYHDERYKIFYGYVHPDNEVDNDALVLKIFYSKNPTAMSDEAFLQNIDDKRKFLAELKQELEREVKDKLNINCNVLIEKIPN